METITLTSRLKITSLVLLSTAFAAVCNAAFTNPDGLWLIADDIAGTGAVSSWATDAGGGASLTLTQGTASSQPTAVASALNGHKVVTFDGGDVLSAATTAGNILSADQSTAVLVLNSPAGQDGSWFGWHKNGASVNPDQLANFYQTSETITPTPKLNLGQGDFGAGGSTTAAAQPAGWSGVGVYHVVTLIRQSDGTGSIRVDGAPLATSPAFTSTMNLADAGTVNVGGLFTDVGDFFNGSIAEIMLYKSGSVDFGAAESALFTKYGLTPVPEPSQYAAVFSVACLLGAVAFRMRRQAKSAA